MEVIHSNVTQGTTHIGSVDDRSPKWMIIIYHLPFLVQVSLLHQKFYTKEYEPYRRMLRVVRLSLAPINVYVAFEIMNQFSMRPLTRRGPLNLQLACWVVHLAMKSIEWGLIPTFLGDPTFQLRPEFLPPNQVADASQVDRSSHLLADKSKTAAPSIHPLSSSGYKDVLVWSFHHLTSLRGINYAWGWKGRKTQSEAPRLFRTLEVLLVSHVMQVIGLIGCVLVRDYGNKPVNVLLAMGVPNFRGLSMIAEGLSTFSWGLLCTYGMEFSFGLLALPAHLMNLFSGLLPLWISAWWDLRLFVPLFHRHLASKSLAELWGQCWHQVYRRSFLFLGALPASQLAAKVGLNWKAQRTLGLFGSFFVSAVMHEAAIRCVAPAGHPVPYDFLHTFPGSLFYFLVQPVGILIEPYVIPLIPAWLGGGSLWVLMFTLVTARPFKNQYTSRVIDDTYPAFKNWTLAGILWPSNIMQL